MRTRSTVRMPFLKMRLSKFVVVSSLVRRQAIASIDGKRVTPYRFGLCRGRLRDDPPIGSYRSVGMLQADDPPDLAGAGHDERMRCPGAGRDLRVGEQVLHLDTKPTAEPISRAARSHQQVGCAGRRSCRTGASGL